MHDTDFSREDHRLQPFDGWALDHLIALERRTAQPTVARVFGASADRRGAIFGLLALRAVKMRSCCDGPHGLDDDTLLDVMFRQRPARVVQTGFGRIVGLLGALRRSARRPLRSPEDYLRLAAHLSDNTPRGRQIARCLAYCDEITSDVLDIIDLLPDAALHPERLRTVHSPDHARALADTTAFVCACCPDLRADRVIAAILRCARFSTDAVMRLLARHATRLPVPVDDAELVWLSTGPQMVEASRRMRNCLDEKVLSVAMGATAYCHRADDPDVIAELHRMDCGEGQQVWLCEDMYASRNGDVSAQSRAHFQKLLRARGVLFLTQATAPKVTPPMLRFLGRYDPSLTFEHTIRAAALTTA